MKERHYYTIAEVARITGLRPYVLRYWEKEFGRIRPRKNTAGRRVYSADDLRTILTVKRLLYQEGYTIEGARRKLSRLRQMDQLRLPFELEEKEQLIDWLGRELKELKDLLGR